MGLNVEIDYGQNSLYYFLVTSLLKNKIEIITFGNLDFVISFSVQNLNLLLFIFSLFGFYQLLKEMNFKNNTIFVSLTLFCFFPGPNCKSINETRNICTSSFPLGDYFF